MYFLGNYCMFEIKQLGITETNFQNLWILILITSIFIIVPLPFLRTINEGELLKAKEIKSFKQENNQIPKELITNDNRQIETD